MRNILLIVLLLIFQKTNSQIIADIGVDTMFVADVTNNKIDELQLPLNGKYKLKVPIFNNSLNQVPLGTCKIKIGLGSKFILDPFFDLLSSEANEYFNWTSELNSGQIQITGDLKGNLPPLFFDTLSFDIIGNIEGLSTVTTNFLISNHNSTLNLSDSDPQNNSTFLPYRIIVPVPVTFTSLQAYKTLCTVNVIFTAEREYDVTQYEVEASKNGINYTTVGIVNANQSIHYEYNFSLNNTISATNLYIRIKSIDRDGQYQYSTTKVINGECKETLKINAYPNPITANTTCTIKAIAGNFNGSYQIHLYDAVGKLIKKEVYQNVFTKALQFNVADIPSSVYLLKIISINNPSEQFQILLKK